VERDLGGKRIAGNLAKEGTSQNLRQLKEQTSWLLAELGGGGVTSMSCGRRVGLSQLWLSERGVERSRDKWQGCAVTY